MLSPGGGPSPVSTTPRPVAPALQQNQPRWHTPPAGGFRDLDNPLTDIPVGGTDFSRAQHREGPPLWRKGGTPFGSGTWEAHGVGVTGWGGDGAGPG